MNIWTTKFPTMQLHVIPYGKRKIVDIRKIQRGNFRAVFYYNKCDMHLWLHLVSKKLMMQIGI